MKEITFPRIMFAGTGSGCGKTTITCAVLRALVKRNLKVASFKCGPDYIDPMFHSEIVGTKSRNLDIFLCGNEVTNYLFTKNSIGCDISVVEGVMGFYDGMGGNSLVASSSDLSLKTNTPVILVVNTKGMGISVAAVIKGFLEFSPNIVKGVILNQTSQAMYPVYKKTIEEVLPVKVLGFMPKMQDEVFESRHLGLITAAEVLSLKEKLDNLAILAEKNIDIDLLIELASTAPKMQFLDKMEQNLICKLESKLEISIKNNYNANFNCDENCSSNNINLIQNSLNCIASLSNTFIHSDVDTCNGSLERKTNSQKNAVVIKTDSDNIARKNVTNSDKKPIRIAITKDKAFCFYYQDSIDLLTMLGCEIIYFSPLQDKKLPDSINGLIIGGGYPELYARQLSENKSMLLDLNTKINLGLPTIAECGGFMYLGDTIKALDENFKMAGILPGSSYMTSSLKRFGYVYLIADKDNLLCKKGDIIRAHEFHYSDSTFCGNDFIAVKASEYESKNSSECDLGSSRDLKFMAICAKKNDESKSKHQKSSDIIEMNTYNEFKTARMCIVATDTLFAGYPHMHLWSNPDFAIRFLEKCRDFKQ